MMKCFVGHSQETRSGMFKQHHATSVDPHWVPCSMMRNPFRDDSWKIFFMICPTTHELKNLIAAIYSSLDAGAKAFVRKGIPFGWRAIEELCRREYDRARP
eukprot:Pompholyxophrys_punicea_v1_NODE_321_length_2256_cov_7.715129.p4 type:complete len:101 gc:universal NODE_321_length_2256_cov_7.715129:991-689(-)